MKHLLGLILLFTGYLILAADEESRGVLERYRQRLPMVEAQLPELVRSSELAATRIAADPTTHLLLARNDPGFFDELLSRAGGLSRAWYRTADNQPFRAGDVVLMSVRDWTAEGEALIPQLAAYREAGCLVILFAPAAGRPDEARCDFLFDNGAVVGAELRGVNILTNATLGWIWCCEYAAALTRLGKTPGILRSVGLDDGRPHNRRLQSPTGRQWLGTTETPVAAGSLGTRYLRRVAVLLDDLASSPRQAQFDVAAALVAERLGKDRPAFLTGAGHLIVPEIKRAELQVPWQSFRSAVFRKEIAGQLEPEDVIVWIGYTGQVGLKSDKDDLLAVMHEKQVRQVHSEAPVTGPHVTPEIEAHIDWQVLHRATLPSPVAVSIEQEWGMPDAEIAIPWPPGWMAPVSGLNALLVLHMLDERVARLMVKR